MDILKVSRALLAGTVLVFASAANAALIDFTDASWGAAIAAGDGTSATLGNITLTAGGDNAHLTFNGTGDQGGCQAGQSSHGLACAGDGIGVNNDEITQSGSSFTSSDQSITISFAEAVDVNDLFVLDLFGSERTGEIAIIDGNPYAAPVGNLGIPGGFYATGYSELGILSVVLSGNTDWFSDYALAAIDVEVSPVPLPGAMLLFGSALLGMFGFKRFS